MVEIAISLAVIGFALVAIIGILPTGMNVQKENRHETIINQDMTVWMNAIRNGSQGLDDLTNYVMAITNSMTEWDYSGGTLNSNAQHFQIAYTINGSTLNGAGTTPQYALTNGSRIVGLLSTPRMVPITAGPPNGGVIVGYYSNYVVASVRSMSGAASEKPPQINSDVQDLGLSYRLISEITPYQEYDSYWTNTNPAVVPPVEIPSHASFAAFSTNLQANLYNVRLIFRWPLFADGSAGNSRQIFRTMVGGRLNGNLDLTSGVPNSPTNFTTLYFFTPRAFANTQ
jgi:hypothetical protein